MKSNASFFSLVLCPLVVCLFWLSKVFKKVDASIEPKEQKLHQLPDLIMTIPAWCNKSLDERDPNGGHFFDATTGLTSPQPYGLGQAQGGEDLYAYNTFFFGMKGGYIVEVGALDGRVFSTSWYFTFVHSWYSIHVEASPMNYARLSGQHPDPDGYIGRPESLNVNAALCEEGSKESVLHYAEYPDRPVSVNGIWEFMALGHKERWWGELLNNPDLVEQLPKIHCTPLTPILSFFNIPHIDLWVVDVEGAEFGVLRTHNFDAIPVHVICAEAMDSEPSKNQAVREFLFEKGFKLHSRYPDTGITNDWFVHSSFTIFSPSSPFS